MFRPKLVLVAVLIVLTLVLVVQNSEVVTVNLLFWSFELSRVVLILLTTATGFVCGFLVARLTSKRSRSS